MQKQLLKPWLTSGGVEIPTEQLKQICQSWDPPTWERYLKWYESACREALVPTTIYSAQCDQREESIFSEFGYETSPERTQLCDELLHELPEIERNVLSLIFLNGKTEREIAAEVNRSQPGVHQIKTRALLRLQRGLRGNEVITRQYMRGEASATEDPLANYAREEKVYDPKNYKTELTEIKHHELCQAVRELSERQQQIIYLRFWCDYSFKQIARDLGIGVNFAEQICDAAVSKLKRKVTEMSTNCETDGGPSCA
ncbi:MAG: sigma factor-like helix-turn-helix DNA-binding protein [Pseudobdellovibrionaceae bacterium]